MTIEQVRKVHESKSFRAFTIVLADGTRVRVRHPEALSHPGSGRTVIVWERPEDYRVIDLLLVTALEVGVNDTRRNGHTGRRSSRN